MEDVHYKHVKVEHTHTDRCYFLLMNSKHSPYQKVSKVRIRSFRKENRGETRQGEVRAPTQQNPPVLTFVSTWRNINTVGVNLTLGIFLCTNVELG